MSSQQVRQKMTKILHRKQFVKNTRNDKNPSNHDDNDDLNMLAPSSMFSSSAFLSLLILMMFRRPTSLQCHEIRR